MIVLGITGTLGAGKGTMVDYLVSEKGFIHYSVRAYISEEIRRRGMTVDRDSMVLVANDLRAKHHPAFIVVELYKEAVKQKKNCVIESIRTPGEVEALRKTGDFYLLAVDADPEKRFHRIRKRNSETDRVDYRTFIENEEREMTSTDPNKQNIRRCIEMSDFLLENSNSVRALHRQIEKVLQSIIR